MEKESDQRTFLSLCWHSDCSARGPWIILPTGKRGCSEIQKAKFSRDSSCRFRNDLELGWESEKASDQWNFLVWQWHDICSDAHNVPPQKQHSAGGERKWPAEFCWHGCGIVIASVAPVRSTVGSWECAEKKSNQQKNPFASNSEPKLLSRTMAASLLQATNSR